MEEGIPRFVPLSEAVSPFLPDTEAQARGENSAPAKHDLVPCSASGGGPSIVRPLYRRQPDLFAPIERSARSARCPTCQGSGTVAFWRKPGRDVVGGKQVICPLCTGTGRITKTLVPATGGSK